VRTVTVCTDHRRAFSRFAQKRSVDALRRDLFIAVTPRAHKCGFDLVLQFTPEQSPWMLPFGEIGMTLRAQKRMMDGGLERIRIHVDFDKFVALKGYPGAGPGMARETCLCFYRKIPNPRRGDAGKQQACSKKKQRKTDSPLFFLHRYPRMHSLTPFAHCYTFTESRRIGATSKPNIKIREKVFSDLRFRAQNLALPPCLPY